jgi:peptide/nickel transport system substrate-binding protein
MDFELTVEQEMMRKNARDFLNKEIAPLVNKYEHEYEVLPRDIMINLFKMITPFGYCNAIIPEEEGGTGPFKFKSRQLDVNIIFEKFDDYWLEGKPYLDGFEFDIIADGTTRMASFKAGEIDVNLDPTVAQVQEIENDPNYVIKRCPGGMHSFALGPSANDPGTPLSNVKVRQALGYAIDEEALVDGIMGGFATVATQQCLAGTWPYNPDLKGYPYDPEKAKQLLAEAGYADGFEMQIVGSSAEGPEPLICAAIQGMLSDVNITAELNLLAALALEDARRGGWEGVQLCGMAPSPSAITFTFASTTKSERYFFVSFLQDPDLDAAVDEALQSPDLPTWQARTRELMKMIYYDKAQLIPLFLSDALLVTSPDVKDINFYVAAPAKYGIHANTWLDR